MLSVHAVEKERHEHVGISFRVDGTAQTLEFFWWHIMWDKKKEESTKSETHFI